MSDELRSVSPSDPTDEIGRFAVSDAAAVSRAVERAHAAFPGWRDQGLDARATILRRFRDRVAELLDVDPQAVGIKATTHERLGSLGRGEGIAALAVVLMSRA